MASFAETGGPDRIDGEEGATALVEDVAPTQSCWGRLRLGAFGGGAADHINGGSGSDSLDGGGRSDELSGGLGWDGLQGGTGADILEGAPDTI